ncbi:MAG: hypothetical protein K0R14_2041 [Burkholderiales bacterium]|jgi:hypothetical protein|nr:hypothetical protein [Burkholderiales bacterium]
MNRVKTLILFSLVFILIKLANADATQTTLNYSFSNWWDSGMNVSYQVCDGGGNCHITQGNEVNAGELIIKDKFCLRRNPLVGASNFTLYQVLDMGKNVEVEIKGNLIKPLLYSELQMRNQLLVWRMEDRALSLTLL